MSGYVHFGRGRNWLMMPVGNVRKLRDNMIAQARQIPSSFSPERARELKGSYVKSARHYNHLAIRALREDHISAY
jgi:hypothetical protein